ncbi:MAG: PilZ domain-containing protein [Proteobacteria bacterium]|nr:PilZ domain-containing protein [Pseudomonadota bacterium]MBU1713792.1 PilZ domain-containing protein [Pseudomonadota bacterium]
MAIKDKNLEEVNITSRLLNLIFDMSKEKKLRLLKFIDEWESKGSRRHNRKPLLIPIDYTTKHVAFKDLIKNISAGGVFIETRMPFNVGQDITMMFRLPKSRKLIQATGEIVRSDSHGIGVKFKRHSMKKGKKAAGIQNKPLEDHITLFELKKGENDELSMAS